MSEADPRRPKPHDDELPGLPALEGDDASGVDTAIELDVADEAESALDDSVAGELTELASGGIDDEEDASSLDDDPSLDPVDADPSLAIGDEGGWTVGSETGETDPWETEHVPEPAESVADGGEEGVEEPQRGAGDELPGLPEVHAGEPGDEGDDTLDVSDAGAIEIVGDPRAPTTALREAKTRITWHGPAQEAVRAIAVSPHGCFIGVRALMDLGTREAIPLPAQGEVAALVATDAALWIATDAGEVIVRDADGCRALPRPGTNDGSLGSLEIALIGDVIVARTRGGALFRSTMAGDASPSGWTGPIVTRPVRKIGMPLAAGARPWLVAIKAGGGLVATRDARTFESMRSPEGIAIDAARIDDVVVVVTEGGALHVSRDAGAHWTAVADVVDVERVWITREASAVVAYAACYHEATDHGRLLRVDVDGAACVVLDVRRETAERRLATPGELDGDGRVHALAREGQRLWVATGVGVFEVCVEDEDE
jgi:hypothetical protein